MLPKQLYELVDAYAPFSISRAFMAMGHRDNSGLLVDCGEEIHGILFSLDLSSAAVDEAKKHNCNCIVTHHPAIFFPISNLGEGDSVLACARAGISVLSAHLNLDAAKEGIDEELMHALGGKEALATMEEVEGGGYGRVYDVEPRSLSSFVWAAKRRLGAERVLTYGDGKVERVASFCGAGFDGNAVAFAKKHGADMLVSSDGAHHRILEAIEQGLNVVLFTHYSAENYGFTRFAEKIGTQAGVPFTVFTDERFL